STAQATHITPGPQRDLQGLWSNQLVSNMTILDMNTAGTFSGSHQTAVAATNKQILVSPLRGLQ
ncbi:AVID protein, partial [Vidua macroura]|nr:AVID protein [Vidua macroura]